MRSEPTPHYDDFKHVVSLIQKARVRANAKVNEELINLYYTVGKFVSQKVKKAEWGIGTVDSLAQFIKKNHPEIKGFTRRGLYRMKQFYETYRDAEFVTTLLTQIPWSAHLHILSKTKTIEEKEFYIRLASKEKLSVRELERHILLCKGKDEEVVEFALARNISPTPIADYETKLIDKKLLQEKLHELVILENRAREAVARDGN